MSQTQISPELIATFESEGYTNRLLTQREIAKMLDDHGVGYTWGNGLLYAGEDPDGDGIDKVGTDTTTWTLFDLLNYLNY